MEATRTTGRPAQKNRPAARRSGRTKKKTTVRTAVYDRPGFLTQSIPPLAASRPKKTIEEKRQQESFFQSLGHLTTLYNISPPDIFHLPYPVNIAEAYKRVATVVEQTDTNLELVVLSDDNSNATLATIKTVSVGQILYYIPIRQVFGLLRQKNRRKELELLLSIYSYLYKVAGIPWYTDNHCFMNYSFEVIEEWIGNCAAEGDTETADEYGYDIRAAEIQGGILCKKISNRWHLDKWEDRLEAFSPASDNEKELWRIAQDFFALFQRNPGSDILNSYTTGQFINDEDLDYYQRIDPDQYLSFYWDCDSRLSRSVIQYIEESFQEVTFTNEPCSVQFFNSPQEKITHDLHFETNLFILIDKLVHFVENYL